MQRLAPYIAVVITAVWVLSLVVDAFSTSYEPSPYVHAAMMAVVGALFGEHIWRRSRNGD